MGDERNIFLSTMPATRRDRMPALAVVGVSAVLFACAVPFAGVPLAPVPAFVASYQSALAINDLITAVLLFSQFAISRSRALLLLASGYLFTAMAAIVHALTFPGLFAPGGLLGAGTQTTVWLYMIWHGGFPLLVLGYALLKASDNEPKIRGSTGAAIVASIVAVSVAMAAFTWLVTAQHDLLPILLSGGHYTPVMLGVVSAVWCLSLAALAVLWLRRPHSVLDVWLMVVMCAWLFDIALSAILNVARFDVGFYLGRIYGLCAASFVLAVLLVDNVGLQAKLARLLGTLRREAASERNLRTERESLFSAVVESSNDAIITKLLDGTITGWNGAAERLFGFTAAEAIGKSINIIVPPDRRDEVRNIVERTSRGEPIEHFETSRVHKDGRAVDVSLSISPIRSASGKIVGISKAARDITESKRTQQALSQEIEERRRIFDTSNDLILVTDTSGEFHPGQPERHRDPRLSAVRHDRTQRGGIHPPRRSRTHPQRDAGGATGTKQAQFRDALCQQGGQGRRAELDRDVVGAGPPPLLHRPRPDRKAGRGSPVAACAEDGCGRPAHGRRRARLQQHPDRDHRHHRHPGRSRRRSSPSSPPSPS